MDRAQQLLFGSFPRRVGTPSQFWVFNEAQFDLFANTVDGTRNAYSTVSKQTVGPDGSVESVISDKVLFDLDGDKSPFPDDAAADERAAMMRQDPDIAAEVLGEVCDEAQRLARASRDDGIPVVGVFSGFGLHIHQLYQPTPDPKVAMTTCAAKYIEELDLQTADWQVVGDIQRICRVPNVERATYRVEGSRGHHQTVLDGRPTGLHTVPLTREELLEVTPQMLLDLSEAPRAPSFGISERPQMPVWSEYRDGVSADADIPQQPVDERTVPFAEGSDMEGLLLGMIQMPCMVDRMMQPNPEHEVRLNAAVLFFNIGLRPAQVEELYAQMGWVDFDRETTRGHLEHIYQNGYSDMSCETIREKRLCTRPENPEDCRCFGWSGGQPEWT